MLANFEKLEKPRKFIDSERVKFRLRRALENSVKKLVGGQKEVPIAFSGGLDSSILAFLTLRYTKPILFCVGYKNSYDVKNAEKVAKLLDLKLNIIYLDDINLKKCWKRTIKIVGTKNRLVVDLNLPLFILAKELKSRKLKSFVSGQGADTLFGGFAKYGKTKNFAEDMFRDIKDIHKTNLQYNFKVCGYFEIDPLYPFLEKEVVELAVRISPELKIKSGVNKYILREAFRKCLPSEIIRQRKKAFQYGSGVHKATKKLEKR